MNPGLESPLADAALSDRERMVVASSVSRLRDNLGADLLAVWLYGSRARREADPQETDPDLRSDVDMLAIVAPSLEAAKVGWDAHEWIEEEADGAGDSPVYYSLRVFDTEWLRDRRRIRSFFIQEVDRDKIVLWGGRLDDVDMEAEAA
jgi:predicted nucleotidyltransferase